MIQIFVVDFQERSTILQVDEKLTTVGELKLMIEKITQVSPKYQRLIIESLILWALTFFWFILRTAGLVVLSMSAVKTFKLPGIIKAFKIFTTHFKCRVLFNSVLSKVLKADRETYKPGTARVATSYHGRFSTLKICSTTIDGTIQELQQPNPPFAVIAHIETSGGDIQEYRAVVSQSSDVVHSGDDVKLHPVFCQLASGYYQTGVRPYTLCIVRGFDPLELPNGQQCLNSIECPLFTLSKAIFTLDSTRICDPSAHGSSVTLSAHGSSVTLSAHGSSVTLSAHGSSVTLSAHGSSVTLSAHGSSVTLVPKQMYLHLCMDW
ncbi:hypothetical protein EMCRGX_G000616 [Ephydatia muelleri]